MIDMKINLGSILTGCGIIGTLIFTQGENQTKVDNLETNQNKVMTKISKNESEIVNLKVSVAKIETKLDDRFDRLEEVILDLE